MYSPNNTTNDNRNTFSNFNGLAETDLIHQRQQQDHYNNGGMMNGKQASDLNSVDSLLMLNNSHVQPAFSRSDSVQSTSTMFNYQINESLQQQQQQQQTQQQQCLMQQQEVSYRKIRPEPVK